MSQRRAGASATEKPAVEIVNESPLAASSLTLEQPSSEMEPLAIDGTNNNNRQQQNIRKQARLKNWKESPFAVGLTEPTWEAERHSNPKHSRGGDDGDDDDGYPRDDTGCGCCSAVVCTLLNADRVGNMAVLHSTTEWVEEITTDEGDDDEETGATTTSRRYTRPRLNIVVGPYWPMLLGVTYPLILVTSWFAWKNLVVAGSHDDGDNHSRHAKHPGLILLWTFLTVALIVSLACTGCRDPGILYRYAKPPPQHENTWRWNDQALTYRPRGAYFDSDTMVVVEEFDHTCPWTGTAIGKKNMRAFQSFVCLVFLCLMMDIFIITGTL